jgi:hypothetical protein
MQRGNERNNASEFGASKHHADGTIDIRVFTHRAARTSHQAAFTRHSWKVVIRSSRLNECTNCKYCCWNGHPPGKPRDLTYSRQHACAMQGLVTSGPDQEKGLSCGSRLRQAAWKSPPSKNRSFGRWTVQVPAHIPRSGVDGKIGCNWY